MIMSVARFDELLQARAVEVRDRDPRLVSTFAKRVGRVAGGIAGIVAGLLPPAVALVRFRSWHARSDGVLTKLLIIADALAILVYVVARIAAHRLTLARLYEFERSGNADVDIRRLEQEHPIALLARRVDRLEQASLALPLIAYALLAPLTIHLIYAAAAMHDVRDFDDWMRLSYLVVGHVHIFVAIAAWLLARRLRATPTAELGAFRVNAWKIYGLTVAVSLIPLLFVTAGIVVLTGLFLPPVLQWAYQAVCRERRVLTV
jgi:hypothetical protein